MKQKRRVLSWLLILVMMIANVVPTFADVKPLLISTLGYAHLENGKDAEMSFKVTNMSAVEQRAHLITALYNEQSNEMMHYNYVVETIAAKDEKIWGACLPIPEEGEYKVKVFAWEDMQSLKLLSNVLEVGEVVEVYPAYEKILEATSTYLAKQTPQAMNSVGGEWAVLGLARSEYPVEDSYYEKYYEEIVKAVKQEVGKTRPFGYKVTETQRIAIALAAIGKDASSVGGIDLIDYSWNKAKHFPGLSAPQNELGGRQGLNELVFGLITIDLQNSIQPTDATITRDKIIDKILSEYRTSEGGFALGQGTSSTDIDMTAMTLQALAPYYETHAEVRVAVDEALNVLSQVQSATGGFGNSESTSQVVVALTSLGIDPTLDARFIKAQNNLITDLLSYYAGEGQFKHVADGDKNMMATEQAHYALVAYDRLVKGKNVLYDMTDVTIEKPEATITVTLEVDRRSIASEAVLEELGYNKALAQPIEVEVPQGSKVVDVLKAAADTYDFDLNLSTDESYLQGIDGITDRYSEAFESFCESFGLENVPAIYQYAGWMYEVNDDFGMGINQDVLKEGDQIDFRYTLYYGPGINGQWINYDWEFIDAYQSLQKLIDSVDSAQYEGDRLKQIEKALNEANQVIQNIDEESQELWIVYIGEKQTSLWGPDSPIESLQNAEKALQMAIEGVMSMPESIAVTPSGMLSLTMGEVLQLEATIEPSDASQEVLYEVITGEDYIAISDTGIITPLKEGNNLCMIKVSSKVDTNISTRLFVKEILPALEVEPQPIGSVSLSIEKRTIGKGDTLSSTEVDLFEGDTAWDVIKRETDARNIEIEAKEYSGNIYIAAIEGDGEFDYGNGSGWKYTVNGLFPGYGVSAYTLEDGDEVRLRFCVTVKGEEFEKPLVELLKMYIEKAKEYQGADYTEDSFKRLQIAINQAETIAVDPMYDSVETEKELKVSEAIGQLIDAIKQLEEGGSRPVTPSDIPDDFMNDIGLNKDFLEMAIGDDYQIVARRLPEIIDNPISNTITHPTYYYEVVAGESVIVNESGYVSAVQEGTSIIAVTYDEVSANGNAYGAISPINTGLFVVHVTDGTDTGIEIMISSEQEGVVKETRSYDTYYFTEEAMVYHFSVDAKNGEIEGVKVNGEVILPQGSIYTASLKNSGNIIEVTARNEKGIEVLAQVVDARKIEIKVENLTDPTRNDAIEVGDEVKVSFKGITLPVYKLATIYNPSWSSSWDPEGGVKVVYTCETLDGTVEGKETQYDLATNNAIRFKAEEEGVYSFSEGHISEGWWGSALGTEKEMDGPGAPNLGAAHHHDVFSCLPDFEIVVQAATYRPATGVQIDKEIPEIEEGESYQLTAEVLPHNTTEQNLIWTASNTQIATIDSGGKLQAVAPGKVIITVQLEGTVLSDEVEVCIIPEQPATEAERTGLKETIEKAKQLDESIYTLDSWHKLIGYLESAERVYQDEQALLAQVEEAKNLLNQAIRGLENDFSVGIQINPIQITTGSQVTIYLSNLVTPEYMAYPLAKTMYTVYQSDIPGLEEIKMENAYVDNTINEEILKTITFTIPETTLPGIYTLNGGVIEANSRHPQFQASYPVTFYKNKMPEIQITVVANSVQIEAD